MGDAVSSLLDRTFPVYERSNDKSSICDFCSGRPVLWSYPCDDFIAAVGIGPAGPLVHEMTGPWAACHACTELIEEDQWEELAVRAATALPGHSLSYKEGLLVFRVLHHRFSAYRTGPRQPA